MSYQLLILPKSWLFDKGDPHKFDVLTKILNKGYSKPMHRYGIILSPRVNEPDEFLKAFELTQQKESFIAVLLGTLSVFSKIESETGFKRNFHYDLYPLSTCFNSDIPRQYKHYFGPLLSDLDVEIKVADDTTIIEDDIADRILAVCGYKTCDPDEKLAQEKTVKHYELTSYVSFLSGSGPELLNFTLRNYLSDPRSPFVDVKEVDKCVLHANMIREHNLVNYYIQKCAFTPGKKPDVLIPMSGENSPIDFGVISKHDFHVTFLRREVAIRT